jgi:hypothetical protein
MFFKLAFEALLKRKRVSRRTGEARENFVMIKTTDFARRTLDDDVAQCDLTIATESDAVAAPNANDRGAVKLFHVCTLIESRA